MEARLGPRPSPRRAHDVGRAVGAAVVDDEHVDGPSSSAERPPSRAGPPRRGRRTARRAPARCASASLYAGSTMVRLGRPAGSGIEGMLAAGCTAPGCRVARVAVAFGPAGRQPARAMPRTHVSASLARRVPRWRVPTLMATPNPFRYALTGIGNQNTSPSRARPRSPFVPISHGEPLLRCNGRERYHPAPDPARARLVGARVDAALVVRRGARVARRRRAAPAPPRVPGSFYYVNVARRSPRARASGSTTSGTSSRSVADCPLGPHAADPLERALDAARRAGAGALHLAARRDAARAGPAVLARRPRRRAADLPHRPRRRAGPARGD